MKILIADLTKDIKNAYEQGVGMEEAERLAAKALYAQIQFAEAIKGLDLDARMRKNGLKAVKAAVYLDEVKKAEKKPSDVLLGAVVDTNELVVGEQNGFDAAEVARNEIETMLSVAKDFHIFMRGIAKGRLD